MPAELERQAQHIKDSEMENGKSEKEAERIAWATVTKLGTKSRLERNRPAKKGKYNVK